MDDTRKLLTQLKALAGQAGRNYFERIRIAEALLSDKHWLAAEHGGDDYRAAEVLEAEFFHDVCGMMGLFDLLHIYRRFPNVADWEKNGFRLREMYAQLKAEQRPAATTERRTAKVADVVRLEGEKKAVEFQLKKVKDDVKAKDVALQTKDERIGELETRVKRLETENLKLRGRLEQMEAVLESFRLKVKS